MNGWLAVSRVGFSENASPPAPSKPIAMTELTAVVVREAVTGWSEGRVDAPESTSRKLAQLEWLLRQGLLEGNPDSAEARRLSSLVEEYQRVAGELPDSMRVPSLVDGTGLDEAVFIRVEPPC